MTSQAFFEKSTRSSSLACHLTGKTVYLGDESICAHFYLHPDHDAKSVRLKLYDVALTSPYLQIEAYRADCFEIYGA